MIRTLADIDRELQCLLVIAPELRPVAERAGPIRLRATPPGLRGLIGTMIGQRVSRASAEAILRRLEASVDLDDAAALLRADEGVMRAAGLSGAKERTLRAIAAAAASGDLDLDRLSREAPEAAIAELVRLPGIGPWTAECFLLFSAGHVDIFPAGDLALRIALGHAIGPSARPTIREVADRALAFAPHRSIAARLFWAFYAAIAGREAAPSDPGANPHASRPIDAGNQGFTKAT